MVTEVTEGTLLWEPPEQLKAQSRIKHYLDWLAREKNLHFGSYQHLWDWSVEDLDAFWGSIWEYFDLQSDRPYETVIEQPIMPGAGWFRGPNLNYAQQAFANAQSDHPAILFQSELQPLSDISW
ncbi:MAG: acetoacetate--CoA ligase, partial [Chloroflexota bacterium]|nr:acetoacetate--CoA ligase [Chloroflexota bacterium]